MTNYARTRVSKTLTHGAMSVYILLCSTACFRSTYIMYVRICIVHLMGLSEFGDWRVQLAAFANCVENTVQFHPQLMDTLAVTTSFHLRSPLLGKWLIHQSLSAFRQCSNERTLQC